MIICACSELGEPPGSPRPPPPVRFADGPLPASPSHRNMVEGPLDLREDLVLAAVRVDRDEVPARAVVLDQRLRLAVVVVEPAVDGVVGVVRAAFDLGTPT